MKPELTVTAIRIPVSVKNECSPLPDLLGTWPPKEPLKDGLSSPDSEKVRTGYGTLKTVYPYRQQNAYVRETEEEEVPAAVLENEYLKAVFLPSFGGRLWRLLDRQSGRELLYTNDVIRFSNLAVRNAWFSGGVEWNIGVIGHNPYTASPLFAARLHFPDGTPVLRMYQYERIRGFVYQMDFWLQEEDRFLNCRMRVENTTDEEKPMYWWSNIAVPEYPGGRIEVPASSAFTVKDGTVIKTQVPDVGGRDVFHYENIPQSTDYFFDLPENEIRYIADLDADGSGLLQFSSARLKARKLFSWGFLPGGSHWQEYLTKKAGRYVEIQAGLSPTQYGCMPMPPQAVWEWMEYYGPGSDAKESVHESVRKIYAEKQPERMLNDTEALALSRGILFFRGDEAGALENACRLHAGRSPLPLQLEFGELQRLKPWETFLETGKLPEPDRDAEPDAFFCEAEIVQQLKTYRANNRENWYALYQLGVILMQEGKETEAEKVLLESLQGGSNAWSLHALACLHFLNGQFGKAAEEIAEGIRLKSESVPYVKEGFRILLFSQAYGLILTLFEGLPKDVQKEGRIRLYRVMALHALDRDEEAWACLTENGGLVPDDICEGEKTLGALYEGICAALKKDSVLPYRFDFRAN